MSIELPMSAVLRTLSKTAIYGRISQVSSTVLIPEKARQTILEELHSTHLSVDYMKAMSLLASMEDHINHVEMVKRGYEHQLNLSRKKGRTSVHQFAPGDRVVIQCNNSGKWLEEGVIEKSRTADDSSAQSYESRMENGSLKLRNKRFIKHATNGPDRHVQFDTQDGEQVDAHDGPDNRGQPDLAADRAESNASRPHTRSMGRPTV